jgi:hypothetical protein
MPPRSSAIVERELGGNSRGIGAIDLYGCRPDYVFGTQLVGKLG